MASIEDKKTLLIYDYSDLEICEEQEDIAFKESIPLEDDTCSEYGWIKSTRQTGAYYTLHTEDFLADANLDLFRKFTTTAAYSQNMDFVGYDIRDVLATNPDLFDLNASDYEVVFQCADNWQDALPLESLLQTGGLFATGLEQPFYWTPLPERPSQTAGPAYFVQPPWPFQVTDLHIVKSEQFYSAAFPHGADATIVSGFKYFKRHCMTCHAVNSVGGKMGPELNGDFPAVEKYSTAALPKMIRNAELFWPNTNMRPFLLNELSDDNIQDLIDYLDFMNDSRNQNDGAQP